MDKGRDGTVPQFFVPVPLVQAGLAARWIPRQWERTGTERDSYPEMPGFVVPQDFSSGLGDLRDRDRDPEKARDNRPSLLITWWPLIINLIIK